MQGELCAWIFFIFPSISFYKKYSFNIEYYIQKNSGIASYQVVQPISHSDFFFIFSFWLILFTFTNILFFNIEFDVE